MPNIRLPQTPVPFQILKGERRDCIVLVKARPFEDWPDFKWMPHFGDYNPLHEEAPQLILQEEDIYSAPQQVQPAGGEIEAIKKEDDIEMADD